MFIGGRRLIVNTKYRDCNRLHFRLLQPMSYFLPMCPVPEQLATLLALKIEVEPAQSFRWNAFGDFFSRNLAQLASTTHATRLTNRKPQFGEDVSQLLLHVKRWRDPDRRDQPVTQNAPLHEHTIGGQQNGLQT